MDQLSSDQRRIMDRAVAALADVKGVGAIVLGGSHARGRARPDSDIDIGLYYEDIAPLDIAGVAAVAEELNDTPNPVVSQRYGWGRWVNGGAWLTIEGQRVDFLYRSLDDVVRTLGEAQAGRFEVDTEQQAPFGFFGPTILGEVAVAQLLRDSRGAIADLKGRVSPMPEALVAGVVQNRLWQVEFGLKGFAPKFAASGDAYGVAGCLTRFAYGLVLTLFALNRAYLLNDKTAVREIDDFSCVPPAFSARLSGALAAIGSDAASLQASLAAIAALFEETRALCGDLYTPPWRF
jgi:predicted nucleotidyltransferase